MSGSENSNNRLLVTGATGFIGSHLCFELVQRGFQVWGLCCSGEPKGLRALIAQPNFHLLQQDIRDAVTLQQLLTDTSTEVIFHLAAQLPCAEDQLDPCCSLDINGQGTLNLLRAAKLAGVKKFIYSSTIDVYTEPPVYLPVDERHPTRPSTAYGIGKLEGELYAGLYSQTMQSTVLRYSIVYGHGGKQGGAVNRFVRLALGGEPLTVYGGGAQSNDFVYVGDVVKANMLALQSEGPGIYNIGSGQETSIRELAQTIIKLTGSRSELVLTGVESNRPFRFSLDISQAQRELGYEPRALEEGMVECIGECSKLQVRS
ncbi:MAG: NAD-dependent epimerase/dehydratase family protein [Chloroflexi bacterium]|nr:NAD-dependent epimerase/dehydratase family protein [Chloroflexota bacterium]